MKLEMMGNVRYCFKGGVVKIVEVWGLFYEKKRDGGGWKGHLLQSLGPPESSPQDPHAGRRD